MNSTRKREVVKCIQISESMFMYFFVWPTEIYMVTHIGADPTLREQGRGPGSGPEKHVAAGPGV